MFVEQRGHLGQHGYPMYVNEEREHPLFIEEKVEEKVWTPIIHDYGWDEIRAFVRQGD